MSSLPRAAVGGPKELIFFSSRAAQIIQKTWLKILFLPATQDPGGGSEALISRAVGVEGVPFPHPGCGAGRIF